VGAELLTTLVLEGALEDNFPVTISGGEATGAELGTRLAPVLVTGVVDPDATEVGLDGVATTADAALFKYGFTYPAYGVAFAAFAAWTAVDGVSIVILPSEFSL